MYLSQIQHFERVGHKLVENLGINVLRAFVKGNPAITMFIHVYHGVRRLNHFGVSNGSCDSRRRMGFPGALRSHFRSSEGGPSPSIHVFNFPDVGGPAGRGSG